MQHQIENFKNLNSNINLPVALREYDALVAYISDLYPDLTADLSVDTDGDLIVSIRYQDTALRSRALAFVSTVTERVDYTGIRDEFFRKIIETCAKEAVTTKFLDKYYGGEK